jgi:hypothetical protein
VLAGWLAGSVVASGVFVGAGALGDRKTRDHHPAHARTDSSVGGLVRYGDLCLSAPPFGWVSDGSEQPCDEPTDADSAVEVPSDDTAAG